MENKANKGSKGVSRSVLVTIVTPSYNQGRFIEETIVSVISQEGDFYIEYLVMDGGSKDNSVEIIKKYERLLKERKWPVKCRGIEYFWVSERDKGQADAVNKGFRAARGEILGWLNSDDTYLPGAVAKAVGYFEAHGDAIAVYGEGYYIDADGNVIERYLTEPFDFKRLAEVCFICQPTAFLRKKVIEEVGLLDEGLNFCMDYDYWIRIAKSHKIGYLPEYLANSRLYAETKTMSKRLEAHGEALKTVKAHYGFVPGLWVLGYADAYVQRFVSKDTRLKSYINYALTGLVFEYKFLQFNGRVSKIPGMEKLFKRAS